MIKIWKILFLSTAYSIFTAVIIYLICDYRMTHVNATALLVNIQYYIGKFMEGLLVLVIFLVLCASVAGIVELIKIYSKKINWK